MEPTLMGHNRGISQTGEEYFDTVHDHIFVNKMVYRMREPRRGEIIVFKAEKKADKSAELTGREAVENVLIKRLVAIPGDTIHVRQDETGAMSVFINGRRSNEPYVKKPMNSNTGASYGTGDEALKLGPGELFVMGDNRNNSNDSRFWGPLPRNRVIGKAELIFWPLSRIRFIR
jgi:signal peptidase I